MPQPTFSRRPRFAAHTSVYRRVNPSRRVLNNLAQLLSGGPHSVRVWSFEAPKDSSVRVAFNRLRNALALYYTAEGRKDRIVIRFAPGCYVPSFSHARSNEEDGPATALRWADWYQDIATMAAHQRASAAVQVELTSYPDHPELLAASADLLLDGHKHGYDDDPRAVEHVVDLIDQLRYLSLTMSVSSSSLPSWPCIWAIRTRSNRSVGR